jgi:hypothetical protein
MDRRTFFRFLGLAPVAVPLAVKAATQPKPDVEKIIEEVFAATGYPDAGSRFCRSVGGIAFDSMAHLHPFPDDGPHSHQFYSAGTRKAFRDG